MAFLERTFKGTILYHNKKYLYMGFYVNKYSYEKPTAGHTIPPPGPASPTFFEADAS